MKKKHILFCSLAVAAVFLVPMIVSLVQPDLMVVVILFLIIDPIFALGMGIAAGFDLRHFWYVPFLTVSIYWLGTGLFITWSTDILFYVVVYLFIGVGAMLVTHFFQLFRSK